MNLDNNGLPMTRNASGWDGGDSLANFCRWKLGELLLGNIVIDLFPLDQLETAPGIYVRHPSLGIDPDNNPILHPAYFWYVPQEVSRDQSKALHWLLSFVGGKREARLLGAYAQRGYLFAQNKDIMLPLYMAKAEPFLFLRDVELWINTAIVCGLVPIVKHDAAWGFGKGKKFFFSWQDSDWCDGDVNLVVDYAGIKLRKRTWLSDMALKFYKRVRGARFIRHYYREESGNNPAIAEYYVEGLDLNRNS